MAGVSEDSRGPGESCLSQPSFVLVAKEHLVGTWLAVFVRTAMLPSVADVRTGELVQFRFVLLHVTCHVEGCDGLTSVISIDSFG